MKKRKEQEEHMSDIQQHTHVEIRNLDSNIGMFLLKLLKPNYDDDNRNDGERLLFLCLSTLARHSLLWATRALCSKQADTLSKHEVLFVKFCLYTCLRKPNQNFNIHVRVCVCF